MSTPTLEERMAVLETKLEQLQQQRELDKSDDAVPWWKKMVGVYQDCPEFEEVVRFGQEWRKQEPSEVEGEA
jgi:hypothetical protein